MPSSNFAYKSSRRYREPGLAKCIDDPDINKRGGFLDYIEELFRDKEELQEEPRNIVLFSNSILEYNSAIGCEHIPVAENKRLFKKIFGCFPDETGQMSIRCLYGSDISYLEDDLFKKGVVALVDCIVEPVTGSNSNSWHSLRGSRPFPVYGYNVIGRPIMKKDDMLQRVPTKREKFFKFLSWCRKQEEPGENRK